MIVAVFGAIVGGAWGRALSGDEQAFFDKHVSDVVKIDSTRMSDPAVVKVFGVPIYSVNVILDLGDGSTQGNPLVVARVDEKLVSVSRPGTDSDCPNIQKMFSPSFKLTSDDDAKSVQQAMDVVYPILGDSDKAAEKFTHGSNQWTFVRGKFFDKLMGFVVTTDAGGTVTGVKYVLKLP